MRHLYEAILLECKKNVEEKVCEVRGCTDRIFLLFPPVCVASTIVDDVESQHAMIAVDNECYTRKWGTSFPCECAKGAWKPLIQKSQSLEGVVSSNVSRQRSLLRRFPLRHELNSLRYHLEGPVMILCSRDGVIKVMSFSLR